MNFPTSSASRREFIRLMALGGAALATAPGVWGQPVDVDPKPGRKLGVALLGLGYYSEKLLAPALRVAQRCELVSVITGSPEKGERWAKEYGLTKESIYSYETMDRIADNKAIDVVYVVTPPALHRHFTERIAKAGKHVISEKPMATTVEDCEAMIAACAAAKVRLSIGYRLHFDPFHRELIRLGKERDFGAFTKMSSDRAFVMRQRAWRIDKKLGGGGPMMDLGIYVIQASCMATGETPVSVTAHEEPKTNPELFNEVEESIRWEMKFASGAVCNALTSFSHNSDQFRAEAPKGWYELTKGAFGYNGIVGATSRGPLKYAPMNQQAAQMDDFADCILTGRATPVPGEMGKRDMRIITAIYEAARTGKEVTV